MTNEPNEWQAYDLFADLLPIFALVVAYPLPMVALAAGKLLISS